MFCTSCGAQLTEDAVFCCNCGARGNGPVSVPHTVAEKKKPFNFAMAITLVLYAVSLCLMWKTSETVISAVGLITAVVLWATGVIRRDALGWGGLVLPFTVVGLALARLVSFFVMFRYSYMFLGEAAAAATSIAAGVAQEVESMWGSDALCFWAMLILALLIRSGKLRRYPWVMLIAAGVFLLWSFALVFLYPAKAVAMQHDLPAEAMAYYLQYFRLYMGTMFVRRTVLCAFFCFFGAKRLGWVWMLLLPFAVTITAVFLLTLSFSVFLMGMAAVVSISAGYLLASLLLIAALVNWLREKKAASQYHAL
ncbi:MAG: zinc ribbon domain-containing protein [Oscillospiraceae bacterium]|nr:zinc ribbon domain-containing protein [Oscillospiraceae bacterium]